MIISLGLENESYVTMGESRLPDSTRESHSNDSQDDALDKDSLDGEETNSGDQQATLLNGGWVVEVERKQRLHRKGAVLLSV